MAQLPIIAVCLATSALAAGVANLVNGIVNDIFNEKGWRETYTQNFIDKMRAQFPNYNVVMIHTSHSVHGNYVHQHVEEDMPIGSIGYEVYFSIIGESFDLVNQGDGGFENWCFIGYNRDGNHIWADATPPPPPPPPPLGQPYTVVQGDTLVKIAQRFLGDGARWNEIKKPDGTSFTEQEAANLQIGQVVFIP